jgi:hypothetical protein
MDKDIKFIVLYFRSFGNMKQYSMYYRNFEEYIEYWLEIDTPSVFHGGLLNTLYKLFK